MKKRFINTGYWIIAVWTLWPMAPVVIAGIIAASCGCKVDEGSAHPCIVFGKDIGQLLYVMGVMGWLAIGTFPTGIIALAIFSVIVWRRNRGAAQDAFATDEEDVYLLRQDLVWWLGLASLVCSFLTAIPALIIAARGRPLETRAKIGAIIAFCILLATVVFPLACRFLGMD